MTLLKQFLKRSLVTKQEGANAGRPQDVLVDPKTHSIALIVLAYGRIPETSIVCKSSEVGSYAEDALVVSSLRALHLAVHDPESLERLHEGRSIPGRTVYSSTGHRLGRIRQIDVDEHGRVTSYWLRRARLGLCRRRLSLTPTQLGDLSGDTVVAAAIPAPGVPSEKVA